ncbi:hypothetical protein ATJ88_1869 [Isoptericola jiangsuensis]|uniref:Uncharacterized protein n=1 Tax=Isoptericola jiangsuensis TaxID=548579 RepID=A0A2A9EY85_9MICO|nr:hypothetical protein [Isoptericola jiangsuensis]PFG43185.1 hypothetical protein ATJ88_1869 [Isoptericola jiangsuensis]
MSVTAEIRAWRARRADRPLPVVDVAHGPAVPGVVLRLAALVPPALLVVAAVTRVPSGVTGLVGTIGGVLLLWLLARPGRGPALAVLCLTAAVLLGSPAAPFDPAVWWMAPLGHATLRGAWWAQEIGGAARVEVAALARATGRDLVVTAAALVAGAVASWFVGDASPVPVVLGGGALLVLVVVLLRR